MKQDSQTTIPVYKPRQSSHFLCCSQKLNFLYLYNFSMSNSVLSFHLVLKLNGHEMRPMIINRYFYICLYLYNIFISLLFNMNLVPGLKIFNI